MRDPRLARNTVKIELQDNGGWYSAPNPGTWVEGDCEECADGAEQEVLRYATGHGFDAQICRQHLAADDMVRLA